MRYAILIATAGCLLVPSLSAAQSSGTFGNRSLGSSVSAGSRSFASGSTSAFGSGAFGQGSLAGSTTQDQSSAGQLNGNERFVRGNRQPAQFVGADSTDATSFFSALTGGIANTGRGRNGGSNANVNSGQDEPVRYRITRTVAFEYPRPTNQQLANIVTQRLASLKSLERLGPIEVTVTDRVATLRGVVATAHARALAEQLVRLEPGVSQVTNELTVAPAEEPQDSPSSTDQPAPR